MGDVSGFARFAGNALYYGGLYAASRWLTPGARKRGIGGGTFQGKFGGRPKRPRHANLGSGYHEKVTYASTISQPQCVYFGVTSYPGYAIGAANLSRMLWDICISIVRKFLKAHHPGRIEVETPDQHLGTFGVNQETWYLMARYPDDSNVQRQTTFPVVATTTIRSLAYDLASQITTDWRDGYEPFMLGNFMTSTSVPQSIMFLNNMVVKASCTNVITVQNQSTADDSAAGETEGNTTVDITANPLKGKLFFFKHIGPEIGSGWKASRTDGTSTDDMWGVYKLLRPSVGTLYNITAPTDAATGCWVTVPKADYFKNCSGVKDVGMEPGTQKVYKIRFKFKGPLTNYLRAENSNFGTELSHAYKKGMGQSVFLVLEKRLRQSATNVKLAYQVDTYIRTDVYKRKQYMTYHVETNV